MFVHKDHNQWAALRIFANHINVSNSRDRGTVPVSEWVMVPRYTLLAHSGQLTLLTLQMTRLS